jgi:hypothetical protein
LTGIIVIPALKKIRTKIFLTRLPLRSNHITFNFEIRKYNDFTELKKAVWEDDKGFFESIGVKAKEESISENQNLTLLENNKINMTSKKILRV